MQAQAMQEHINQVFQDADFVNELFALATPQEVQAALAEKQVALTVEEIIQVRDLLVKYAETGYELSDSELAEIQGGCVGAVVIGVGVAVVLGLIAASAAFGGLSVGIAWAVNDQTHGAW